LPSVRSLPGVREFLDGLNELKIRPVLATSSEPDEVERNLAVIAGKPEHFLIVHKADIQTSKPAPDVFAIALERSGARAKEAVAAGDTRWDAEAATKVGVTFFGLLTGAGMREELNLGGASQVFPDLLGLLAFLKSL